MSSIAEIRSALADALAAIPGVQASPYQLSNPTPPTIQIVNGGAEYDVANRRGLDRLTFRVQALVGLTTDIGAQKRLDELLESTGSSSVKAAIELEPTLAGLVSDLRVVRHDGQVVYVPEGKGPMLGAEWTLEVLLQP